jgi:hypothetical protein
MSLNELFITIQSMVHGAQTTGDGYFSLYRDYYYPVNLVFELDIISSVRMNISKILLIASVSCYCYSIGMWLSHLAGQGYKVPYSQEC